MRVQSPTEKAHEPVKELEPPPSSDEAEAPVGPSPDEEAAFLSEQSFQEAASAPLSVASAQDEDAPTGPLPALGDLVQRIPAPARELMDELFRARFVTVKRVPKSALKN